MPLPVGVYRHVDRPEVTIRVGRPRPHRGEVAVWGFAMVTAVILAVFGAVGVVVPPLAGVLAAFTVGALSAVNPWQQLNPWRSR